MHRTLTKKSEVVFMQDDIVYVSAIRETLEGLSVRPVNPQKMRDIQRLQELIQDLLQTVAQQQGLSIGVEEYEVFASDSGKVDFRMFEKEERLLPTGVRQLRRIQELIEKFKHDPSIMVFVHDR